MLYYTLAWLYFRDIYTRLLVYDCLYSYFLLYVSRSVCYCLQLIVVSRLSAVFARFLH